MTPLIFQSLGIKCDSTMHARARSTQGTVSPKELARPEEGLTDLFLANEPRYGPKQFLTVNGTQHAFNDSNSLRDSRAASRS